MLATDILFDSRTFQLDPWSIYTTLRKENPVFWSPANGCYFIADYKTVKQVLLDQERFTVEHPFRTTRHLYGPTIIDLDGERHKRLRNLVSARFRNTSVRDLTEKLIRPVVRNYIELIGKRETIEVMSEFAEKIPTEIILRLIGLPARDSQWVSQQLRPIMRYLDYPREGLTAAIEASEQLERYVEVQLSDDSRIQPDTMLADLQAAKLAGRVTASEIVSHVLLFLSAGTETTIGTIGNLFVCLLEHPEVVEEAEKNAAIIPKIIQETLRFEPPLHTTTRISKESVDIAGVTIPKGSFVQLLIASANRDEAMFHHSEEWNPYREQINNLSFGGGSHNCIGFQLALKELEVVLQEVLAAFRFSQSLVHEKPIIEGRSFRCPRHLWLQLEVKGELA